MVSILFYWIHVWYNCMPVQWKYTACSKIFLYNQSRWCDILTRNNPTRDNPTCDNPTWGQSYLYFRNINIVHFRSRPKLNSFTRG